MYYLIILVFLIAFSFAYDLAGVKKGKLMCFSIIFFSLALLAGLRYRVGGDTSNYMYQFQIVPSLSTWFRFDNFAVDNREIGWVVFSVLCKTLSDDFLVLQLFHAIFVNLVIFYFVIINTKHIFLSILLYYTLYYPFANFEILRQSISVCIFAIWGIKYFNQNKWGRYFLIVSLATSFHYSSIILMVFPFVKNVLKMKVKGLFICSGAVFLLGVFFNSYVIKSLNISNVELAILKKMEFYIDYNFTLFGILLSYLKFVAFPILLFYFLDRFNVFSKTTIFLNFYIMIASLAAAFPILYRMNYFITPVYIVCLAEVLFIIFRRTDFRRLIKLGFFYIALSGFIMFHNFEWFKSIDSTRDIKWYIRWHPYYSIFSKELSPDRESLLTL